MQISLVILAAGLGTRFKDGVKQSASVGPNGEWLLDYSIYDAKAAGFDDIVLVIREDMKEFESLMKKKYGNVVKIRYVYQRVEDIPCEVSYKREKPWGTGHAVYSLRKAVNNPFCVMNADDYYGKDAIFKMYGFLKNECNKFTYSMIGYSLIETLSENKGVNRGICEVENDFLKAIKESYNITECSDNNVICSMGMYGFHHSVFDYLEEELIIFLKNNSDKEFLLSDVMNKFIKNNIKVKVISTTSKWIGITYNDDLEKAKNKLANLELYSKKLF